MSRDQLPPPAPEDEEPPPTGHLRTTSPGALTAFGLVGLVAGWSIRWVSLRLDNVAPRVGWLPVLALFLTAAIIAAVAWGTHRALARRQERLEPHQAVNRLVLAKSCALAGAAVTGSYLGYALSWLGAEEELAGERMWHSLLAAAAGALTVTGSLLLERACRVKTPPR